MEAVPCSPSSPILPMVPAAPCVLGWVERWNRQDRRTKGIGDVNRKEEKDHRNLCHSTVLIARFEFLASPTLSGDGNELRGEEELCQSRQLQRQSAAASVRPLYRAYFSCKRTPLHDDCAANEINRGGQDARDRADFLALPDRVEAGGRRHGCRLRGGGHAPRTPRRSQVPARGNGGQPRGT